MLLLLLFRPAGLQVYPISDYRRPVGYILGQEQLPFTAQQLGSYYPDVELFQKIAPRFWAVSLPEQVSGSELLAERGIEPGTTDPRASTLTAKPNS